MLARKIQVESVAEFMIAWEAEYVQELSKISIFNPEITVQWTKAQIEKFVRIFYHARGHFHEFLWYLGNHAENRDVKRIVLENIAEEFNGGAASHEQMFIEFAKSHDVELKDEYIDGKSYVSAIRDFNKGHLRWLADHSAEHGFAAFSAYERLDNIDYGALAKLAESIGTSRKGLIFFNVHLKAQHFETTEGYLEEIWQNNSEAVRESFSFITYHQLQMWRSLAALIESIHG
ncbi:MAG: iron-containing redox enzyme family protein [Candidatus Paracaedibacteraceae bacterium]|nr:iron-containing redox enzyme family protein [Candidatus Paracaedibacteraceae bacterium]